VLTRYALDVLGGVDWLAVTHLDSVGTAPRWSYAHAWVGDLMAHRVRRNPDGGVCALLPMSKPVDQARLDEQARLTRELTSVMPVVAETPGEPDAVLSTVERLTGTRVGWFSDGQTSEDVHRRAP
jgi:adenylosuccinate synthase